MSHSMVLAGTNFLLPDATFIAEVFAFLIILAVIWRWVVPPLQRSMNQRQEAIRKQLDDAREAKERLDSAEAEYKRALTEARAEAVKIREDASKTRREMIEAAKDEARREAETVTRRAEERLESERRQTLTALRAEIGSLAVELAGRIVGESLQDDARQRAVTDRFLSELDQKDPAERVH